MRKLLGTVVATAAAVVGMAAPAHAATTGAQACDLYIADGVYSSAEMFYVAVSLDGCSTDVREVWVKLQRSDSPNGPFTTYDETRPYQGGGAWFGPYNQCGYWRGVATWQDQTEITPDVNWGCA
ncbi:hypothetical protein ACI2LF_20485 [Kribbella sp. NPDC020789]